MTLPISATYHDDSIGADVDGKPIPPGRLVNQRRHECGCVTAFDAGRWQSITLVRCATHVQIASAAGRSTHNADSTP